MYGLILKLKFLDMPLIELPPVCAVSVFVVLVVIYLNQFCYLSGVVQYFGFNIIPLLIHHVYFGVQLFT